MDSDDIITKIIIHCTDIQSIYNLRLVCKQYYNLINSQHILSQLHHIFIPDTPIVNSYWQFMFQVLCKHVYSPYYRSLKDSLLLAVEFSSTEFIMSNIIDRYKNRIKDYAYKLGNYEIVIRLFCDDQPPSNLCCEDLILYVLDNNVKSDCLLNILSMSITHNYPDILNFLYDNMTEEHINIIRENKNTLIRKSLDSESINLIVSFNKNFPYVFPIIEDIKLIDIINLLNNDSLNWANFIGYRLKHNDIELVNIIFEEIKNLKDNLPWGNIQHIVVDSKNINAIEWLLDNIGELKNRDLFISMLLDRALRYDNVEICELLYSRMKNKKKIKHSIQRCLSDAFNKYRYGIIDWLLSLDVKADLSLDVKVNWIKLLESIYTPAVVKLYLKYLPKDVVTGTDLIITCIKSDNPLVIEYIIRYAVKCVNWELIYDNIVGLKLSIDTILCLIKLNKKYGKKDERWNYKLKL